MKRLSFFCIMLLCQFAFLTQVGRASGSNYLPSPPWVNAVNTAYTLTLKTSPANAGSFNRSSGQQFEAGNSIYMYAYNNTGYVFDYWMSGDSIVSRDRSFYFIMPEEDAELTAVYHFDPSNPPNPDTPDQTKKYTLTLSTQPANAGSFNRNSGEQFSAGQSVYMYYYNNSGFKFDYWMSGDSIVSYDRYFYFTMPEHDAELTAVYHFDPSSPANPDTAEVRYKVSLETKPANAGYFNWNATTAVVAGRSCDIYAYNNTGFVFREWQQNGETVETDRNYRFQMPAEDIRLTAVYDFNPSNPQNPGKNYWNAETGEVIVDEFSPGSLYDAVYQTTGGNYNQVQTITVAGPISQYDWGIVNNYSNCTFLDMSRTYGLTYVPSYNFSGNTTLTTVVLPSGIEKIEYYAFQGCSSLSSISIYASTPPTIGYRAFEGIGDSIVYVPADALALYQEAEGWKDFTILPLSNQVSALEVNLPQGTDPSLYKDMYIELINSKSGQKQRYVITNRTTYTFNSLIHRTSYNVYLKNAQGDVLGEVDGIDIVDHDVSVTFESLMVPRDLTLQVLTPEGQDVTGQTTITWMNAQNTYLTKGNTLTGQLEGAKAKFRITLPQTLGMQYLLPADSLYEVMAENNICITLKSIPQTTIGGRVLDIKTGKPLSGAIVVISQLLNGLFSKSFTVRTDNKGQWNLQVNEAKTDITASMTDYVSQTQSFETLVVEVPAFELKDINGTTISLNLTYTAVSGEMQSYYGEYANVAYAVFNETTQKAVSDFNVQYPQIVLMQQLPAGTVLRVTATSKNQKFVPVTATTTVDELDCASVTLPIVQLGGISASFKQTDNPSVVGILYDGNGRLLNKYEYASAVLNINELQDGDYTLVTMANSIFFNSVATISQFAGSGLREGTDYVKNNVTVKSGAYTAITNQMIPYLDETKLYYTGENTSFTVNKSQVTAGQYLTLRGFVDFKPTYSTAIKNIRLVISLPDNCSLVEQSVMLGKVLGNYSYEGNNVIIPLQNLSDALKLCIMPSSGGSYNVSAFVEFDLERKQIKQPIGSVKYFVQDLDIHVTNKTCDSTLVVRGIGLSNSTINVYDGNVLIGQTKTMANGNWKASCTLWKPYDYSYHDLYAEIVKGNNVITTSTKTVTYARSHIDVTDVTMIYNSYQIKFDFTTKTNSGSYYSYVPGNSSFTFLVNFTKNDTTMIHDVVVKVFTSANTTKRIQALYDKKKKCWVANSDFWNTSELPINVSVGYYKDEESFNDKQRSIDEYANIETAFNNLEFYIDENYQFEPIIDEEDISVTKVFDNKTHRDHYLVVEDIDPNILQIDDFIRIEGENNCYVKETLTDDSFEAIILEENKDVAYKISLSFNIPSSYDQSPRRAITWSSVGSGLATAGEFAFNYIIPFLDYGRGVADYNFWKGKLPTDDNEIDKERQKAYKLLMKTCPDGSYKLDKAWMSAFYESYKQLCTDHANFSNTGYELLEVWRKELLKQFAFEAATMGLGKLLKLVPNIRINKVNKKNAKYWQYLVKGGRNNREQVENMIENQVGKYGGLLEDYYVDGSISETFSAWEPKTKSDIIRQFKSLQSDIKSKYKKCGKDDDDDDDDDNDKPNDNLHPSIDPSGYVYEAVSSNRLQGVTATAYYKETVEDMYGDLHENVVLWDAEEYAQQNPLFTDEYGMYQWDVPQGLWQVKFEKEGYQTTYSEWLPVPPPQLEVNIPMTQMLQPTVASAKAYSEGVEFEFDKYMDPETLNADNILVTKNGNAVTGVIKLLNEEPTYEGETQTYASKVRFEVPENEELLSTDEVQLTVRKAVKSYAGVPMQDDYTQKFDVELQVRSVAVDQLINVAYGGTRTITVAALPTDAAKGKTMSVKSLSSMIATTDAETLTLDENGQAELTVTGELPGSTVLNFTVDGTEVEGLMSVNVKDAAKLVAVAPRASRISGTEVYRGTKIRLTSETENAVIKYTLDGTCPCDANSESVLTYNANEPIIIADDNVTIKAIAAGQDLGESDVVEFNYSLKKSSLGYNTPAGWTWISHNLEDPIPVSTFYKNADRIVSQSAEVINDPMIGMIGNLYELKPVEGYKLKVTEQTETRLNGNEFNATENTVSVKNGWNWIGYPLNQVMTLNEALAYANPISGDMIVGQNGFAQYDGNEWVGSLEGFKPGEGYLYKSEGSNEIQFNTTIVSDAVSQIGKRKILLNSPWAYDKHAYQNIMPVTAELYDNGSKVDNDEYIVGAFVDTECRGIGQWKEGRLLMNVYSDKSETVHYIAASKSTDKMYDIVEHTDFTADNVGTWNAPMSLNIGNEATSIEQLYGNLRIIQNMSHGYLTVSAGGRYISRLTLTDMGGTTVLSVNDIGKGGTIATGYLPDGVYIVTVQAEGNTYYQKILKANK